MSRSKRLDGATPWPLGPPLQGLSCFNGEWLKAVSNTSPLIFLEAAGHLDWLDEVFEEVWVPTRVIDELSAGAAEGYSVPAVRDLRSVQIIDSAHPPSEWLALDLGAGELAAMALALESPDRIDSGENPATTGLNGTRCTPVHRPRKATFNPL